MKHLYLAVPATGKPIKKAILTAMLTLASGPVALSSAQAAPTDCSSVVKATVAELRAGYPDWTPALESVARTAAGSACIKATSSAPALSTTAVKTASSETKAVEQSAAVAEEAAEDETSEAKDSSDKDDDDWNPFSDLKFNDVSGRPGKKPYERRRESVE